MSLVDSARSFHLFHRDSPMAFFRNSTVNLLNVHYGIYAVALSGGGAFFAAYLLKSGVPVAGVFASYAAILASRFAIRPLVLVIAKRIGVRRLVIGGTVLSAAQYTLLPWVNGVGEMLILVCAISAFGETLYWSAYHAYFASLGDDEHRGHQIGVREAIAAVAGILSPLVAGWLLVTCGPRIAFDTTFAIMALSAVPLGWTPEVTVPKSAPGAFRAALPGILLFISDGLLASGYVVVWQVALFLSLGGSYLGYGGALAAAALVGAVGGMLLGRSIDAGHGTRAVWAACAMMAVIIALRALALGHPALVVAANAVGALGGCLYTPVLMTAVYNRAKRSACTLRFHVATEGGWDFGGTVGLLTCAGFVELGVPLALCVLVSFAGLFMAFALLRSYYAANPDTVIDAPAERPVEL
jgi:hypothetical protein